MRDWHLFEKNVDNYYNDMAKTKPRTKMNRKIGGRKTRKMFGGVNNTLIEFGLLFKDGKLYLKQPEMKVIDDKTINRSKNKMRKITQKKLEEAVKKSTTDLNNLDAIDISTAYNNNIDNPDEDGFTIEEHEKINAFKKTITELKETFDKEAKRPATQSAWGFSKSAGNNEYSNYSTALTEMSNQTIDSEFKYGTTKIKVDVRQIENFIENAKRINTKKDGIYYDRSKIENFTPEYIAFFLKSLFTKKGNIPP